VTRPKKKAEYKPPKRSDLVNHIALEVRYQCDVRSSTLDMLSELERSGKWNEAASRVPDGGEGLEKFLQAVESRVRELKGQ
jgi:hypothetical protein